MGAPNCEKCGAPGKTYWVGDKEWLCATCFKRAKASSTLEELDKDLWGV